MKNVQIYRLSFIILIIIIIITSLNLYSLNTNLYFEGYSYRANDFEGKLQKEIKQIEITNLSNNAKLLIDKIKIKKEDIIATSVINKSNSVMTEILQISIISKLIEVNVNSAINRDVIIQISDFRGKVIHNDRVHISFGLNNFSFPINDIDNGLYIISIYENYNLISKNLFVVMENDCFLNKQSSFNSDLQYQKLNETIGYKFIAFPESYNHQPDTVFVNSLDELDTLRFYFKDKSLFNFRTGSLSIKNIFVKILNEYTGFNDVGFITDTSTIIEDKSLNIEYIFSVDDINYLGLVECSEVVNKRNIVEFCNVFYKDIDFIKNYGYIRLDTISKMLYVERTIYESRRNYKSANNYFGINFEENINFESSIPIPYTTDTLTGEITGYIKLNKKNFNFSYSAYEEDWTTDPDHPYLESETYFNNLEYGIIDGQSSIEIKLIP